MHHYEITVTPLSEEARANDVQSFTEQVDAYVLSAIREEGGESVTPITELHGKTIVWGAFSHLVERLMAVYPEQTAAALEVATAHVRAENRDKKMN